MQFGPHRRPWDIAVLAWGGAIALALAACGGTPLPPKVADDVTRNCQANVDTSQADLKFCAQDKAESCANISKDLEQIKKLKPKNQATADEVSKHVIGCQGKGEADPECSAAASAIDKLDCAD